MFFRNLTLFRFPAALRGELSALDDALTNNPLKPVGPLELSSRGFVSPFGRDEASLCHRVNDGLWFVLGGEDKILPGAVVNEMTDRKAAQIEETEGRKLGGRARKRLRDEVLHALLPRAFVRPVRLGCHIDLQHGLLAIDTSSRRAAEGVVSELREALGSFPAVPVSGDIAPRSVLTGWLSGEELPDGLLLGDECELRDPVDRGATVRASRQELGAEEVAKHLEAGKQCSRLGLVLDEHLSFVLCDDFVVRKLKFLDGAVESLEATERDSQRAELDARYALMVGELRRLFAVISSALQLREVS